MLDFGYTCQTLLEIHGNPSDFVRTTKKNAGIGILYLEDAPFASQNRDKS